MRKYKNEKNHDIIEDKTDEMDDVHLDLDELDEILDDFEPGNITSKHTPKQKKKAAIAADHILRTAGRNGSRCDDGSAFYQCLSG